MECRPPEAWGLPALVLRAKPGGLNPSVRSYVVSIIIYICTEAAAGMSSRTSFQGPLRL